MKPPLLFAHGWGYDRSVWDPVVALLPGRRVFRCEAGFLGAAPDWPAVPSGAVLVGHSAGVAALLGSAAITDCAALVSINGFTRFAAADGFPGVAERVLSRMRRGFAAAPDAVLDEFRRRGGDVATAVQPADPAALASGLQLLQDLDARDAFDTLRAPVLALAAEDDAIVSPAHATACFAAEHLRWSRFGGHVLPLTRPDWCAALIDDVAC